MSPSRWVNLTNAIGFISKRGKYDGGTFAHPDIALEFASWIDPAFKLYLIKEFERLEKLNETARKQLSILSKNKNILGIEKLDRNLVVTNNKNNK